MSANLKVLAHAILSEAQAFEWSLQGMGMLRLHLPNHFRLHIWDSRYRAPGVSMIHDHLQWGLESTIIAGRLTNRKYRMKDGGFSPLYTYATLKPGAGCYFKDEPRQTHLITLPPEYYHEGDGYSQIPDEIHETDAEDGTVTLMQKFPTKDDSARVFWPAGTEWGSAEPRAATPEEVADIAGSALAKWF